MSFRRNLQERLKADAPARSVCWAVAFLGWMLAPSERWVTFWVVFMVVVFVMGALDGWLDAMEEGEQ